MISRGYGTCGTYGAGAATEAKNIRKPRRSKLTKTEARKRYATMGKLVVLEQIREDSELLGEVAIAVGPFARIDAGAVAARDGKSRGAITNVFGSQAAFQAATMELALNASEWVEQIKLPAPGDFATATDWLDALLDGQSARGPKHAKEPAVDDGFLWTLWLSVVPYGVWSEHVAGLSLAEYVQWVKRLEQCLEQALHHFGLRLRESVALNDLACAIASIIEGVWLNQCLSDRHPCDPSQPVATSLRRSGRLLWQGAVQPSEVA